ncbi:MAG: PAS domain-containing sensor histidine kinase [Methanomicrobiales archaeon]
MVACNINAMGDKWTKKALRESEEKYRRLAENSPDMIYRMSLPDGKYEYVNPASVQLTGYTPEEHYSHPCLPEKIIHPDWQQYFRQEWKALLKGEMPPFYEYQIIDRAGKNRWFHQRNILITDECGHPIAIEGIVTDITERKEAEAAMQASEKRLRRFYESGLFGVIFWNMDGEITDANDKFLEMVGYTREDMKAGLLNGFTLTPPEFTSVDDNSVAELTTYGVNKVAFEKEYIRKDGTRIPVILAGAMLDENRFEGVAFVLDITKRKEAEAALRQSNRQLNLISGITRHDILNKITTILGYLSLAEIELKNPLVSDYFSNIESATKAIRSQIEFTKVYENLGTHEPQWQDLNIIIALSPHLPSTIRLIADVEDIEVYADPMLERVFYNLLDNSSRHGEHVTEIRVSSRLAEDVLTILWEDNGIGIPADEKEKIFERGFGKNTGLGMFLVREVLSLTGITIKETGVAGKGARFEINVPKGMYHFKSLK